MPVQAREAGMAKGKKPLVVVTRKLPDTVETRMRELFDARLNVDDRAMSHAELVAAVKSADVLVPTITDRIDTAVLSQAGGGYSILHPQTNDELYGRVLLEKIGIRELAWAQLPRIIERHGSVPEQFRREIRTYFSERRIPTTQLSSQGRHIPIRAPRSRNGVIAKTR
jgi:hypothetical protein